MTDAPIDIRPLTAAEIDQAVAWAAREGWNPGHADAACFAAQDPEDPGVLVLSRFAGVAEEMPEAVLVNPYLAEDVADGIARALQMSNKKRRQIHSALLSGVLERPARRWAKEFLDTLRAAR